MVYPFVTPIFLTKMFLLHFINIASHLGVGYNFKKYRPGEASTLGEPYDKQSVMHYGK